MKRNIYYYNNLLRIYNKYRRKLINLRKANKNARRQDILEKHISRLFEKLSLLKMTIAQKTVAATIAIGTLAFAPQTANAQSFATKQINPFSLSNIDSESAPTFADLDGDGDLDMLAGTDDYSYVYLGPYSYTYEFKFQYFENTGTSSNPVFASPVVNPFGITGPTDGRLAPSFVDLDNDGDMDLMYGDDNGDFYYLQNTGTATAPAFAPAQTNPFGLTGGLYAFYSGLSTPTFVDLDNDGDFDMISGSGPGDIFYFQNTGTASSPAFAAGQENPFGLPLYSYYNRIAPSFTDIDGDGDFDLLTGNGYGDFLFYENTGSAAVPAFSTDQVNPFNLTEVGYYSVGSSKPAFVDLDNDGDVDLMAGDDYGDFNYYKRCTPSTSTISPVSACNYITPSGQLIDASGTYTDIILNASGCDSVITINLTITSILDQSFVSTSPVICGTSGDATIGLTSSQSGVNYYLRDDSNDAVVDGPILGTGSGISFNTGVISTPTTYNVYADKIVNSTGLSFDDNDDYVDAGTGVNLANSSFSVEFWAKKGGFSTNGDDHIIGIGESTNSNEALHIGFRGSNSFTFAFFGNDLDANSSLTDLNWNHWAVTFDANTKERRIYLNGAVVANDVSASNFIGTGNLKIGRAYNANNNNFSGQLDEVRIWNVVRTGAEISANMNSCLAGSESGLLAYYKFEDGTGSSTLADATSNANNGTLQNMDPNTDWAMGAAVCATCNLEMSQTVTVTFGATVDATVDNTASPTLSSNQSGATYQWVDCNNGNAPIAGETGQTFTATASGSYAVEVTFNGCTTTSACETISLTGIEQATTTAVSIYPNPTNGIVNIKLGGKNAVVDYFITTVEGRLVESGRTSSNMISVDLSKEGNGIYFLRINSTDSSSVHKLIKQ
ncbi:MAG: VCBS repeat-containing protein [Bacteroidia bacterium]|nr:VCBS repeat-containing protein [Bacteroidia bacterium]